MPWVPKSAADSTAEEKEEKPERKERGKGKVGKDKDGGTGGKDTGKGKAAYDGGKDGWKPGKGSGKRAEAIGGFDDWNKGGKRGKGKGNDREGNVNDREHEDFGGNKGAPKGGGKKGKGKGDKGEDGDDDLPKPERTARSEDARRQVIVEEGQFCHAKKHSSMGCAVVTFKDPRVRQAVLNSIGAEATISDIKVKLKPHFDKDTNTEVITDLFVGWGRQVEKTTPLSEADLVKYFDDMHASLTNTGRLDAISARPAVLAGIQRAAIVAPAPQPTLPMQQHQLYAQQQQQQHQTQHQQQYQAAQAHAYQQHLQQMQYYYQMQQQQAMYHQQLMAAHQAQGANGRGAGAAGGREFKAAYRRPTDEEVKTKLQKLPLQAQAAAAAAAETTPAPAPAEAAPAAADGS
mmetsp:Transcript_87293/g.222396  ORF Transcript_87293/g.222396 Transcript_87293/m.222396 type:complete len:403 (-) Transcript_87293:172-1380(-)